VTATFAFAVCQHGAARALEAEVAARRPAWRVAWRRPGLLTFKLPEGEALALRGLTEAVAPRFGRVCGASLGLFATPSEAAARIRAWLDEGQEGGRPLRLLVAALEPGRPGEASETRLAEVAAREAAWREGLTAALAAVGETRLAWTEAAAPGEWVVDILVDVARSRDGAVAPEQALVGVHVAGGIVLPGPGGTLGRALPPEAPSWAWRKCEEGLALTGFRTRPGQVAVELGAAPGGAVVSLLSRGVSVTAIDPQPMDPRVEEVARAQRVPLTVIAAPMAAVALEALPARVDWLLVDAHLAGPVALKGLSRYVRWLLPRGLRGLLWTLKLHRWEDAARVDELLDRLEALGFTEVGARQLPSNRQELLLWAAARGVVGPPGTIGARRAS
jgi:23S rRNA (cytidine2498-2'-O)-methyltransferase